jgi:allantoinase
MSARVALWVLVSVEWFRFDGHSSPFLPLGAPSLEYPDYWGYTQRDYGNRVGVFRLAAMLDELGVRTTAAVNSEVCRRSPFVIEEATRLDWELIGHGRTSSEVLHEGLTEAAEEEIVSDALATLRAASGQPVVGWLSPSLCESTRTPDILARHGIEYVCDWANDDVPYPLQAGGRTIWSLPSTVELNDAIVIGQQHLSAADFRDLIVEQCERLAGEPGESAMCVALHPWIAGVPHRVRYVEEALRTVVSNRHVWSATGSELLAAFRRQAGR